MNLLSIFARGGRRSPALILGESGGADFDAPSTYDDDTAQVDDIVNLPKFDRVLTAHGGSCEIGAGQQAMLAAIRCAKDSAIFW
jgi:hypothetical protein